MIAQSNNRLKNNNFDLLRFLFAAIVCLVHSHQLSGFKQLEWIGHALSSEFAIKSFFVISGFLIFMSYERSSSLTSYFLKRARRIYPAYLAIVILCAFLLFSVSSNGFGDYFSLSWLKYLIFNISFLNFLESTLPGVFNSNSLTAVNGALWTIKIEVMFYIFVPLFVALFRRFSRILILVLTYSLSILYLMVINQLIENLDLEIYTRLSRQLPGQLCYFMAGATFYYYLPIFERYLGYSICAAILILAINIVHPLPWLEPVALATVVMFFGLYLYQGNFGKYGDFSYGIYIVHFPIIQVLLTIGWFQQNPWCYLFAVLLMTLFSAVAMWHLVEKHFLLRSNHYISTTLADAIRTAK